MVKPVGEKVNGALTSLDLGLNDIDAEGAKAIGDALRVNGALMSLNLRYSRIDDDRKAALYEIATARPSLTISL